MQDLAAVVNQLRKAGITPKVQVFIGRENVDIDAIKAVQTRLKAVGITPEFCINLQLSPAADTPTGAGTQPAGAPTAEEPSFTVVVTDVKTVAHAYSTSDKAGKPIMQIKEPRLVFNRGARFKVSASNNIDGLDTRDGTIKATGNIEFYKITECPSNRAAEGSYIKKDTVSPA